VDHKWPGRSDQGISEIIFFPIYKLEEKLFRINAFNIFQNMFFFPWRYTTHSGCVFYSPLSGFSLLVYDVT